MNEQTLGQKLGNAIASVVDASTEGMSLPLVSANIAGKGGKVGWLNLNITDAVDYKGVAAVQRAQGKAWNELATLVGE